jgi:hypothetical protein
VGGFASAAATRAASGSISGSSLPLQPDPLIAALRTKNSRLEREIAAMKETWTAYLDLILENQKAQEAERERAEAEAAYALANASVESTPTRPGGARIVRPVKAGSANVANGGSASKQGFFATLKSKFDGRSKKTPTSPAPNEGGDADSRQSTPARHARQPSSAASSTFNSPNPEHRRQPSSGTPAATPTAAAGTGSSFSSPAGPAHTRQLSSGRVSMTPTVSVPGAAASGGADSNSFLGAIRIGYLAKRPVGFSLTRAWRERLFVLRPHSLDYYELSGLGGNSGAGGSNDVTPSATPRQSVESTSSSPLSQATRSSDGSVSLSSPSPSNLLSRLRGSVSLDGHTSVVAANYGPEAPFGFEVTTRDKHSKLLASSEVERQAWMADLLAVVSCIKRGVDPAVLIPHHNNNSAVDSSPEDPHPQPQSSRSRFSLDPQLVSNANLLLQSALERVPGPEPSPTAALAAAAAEVGSSSSSSRSNAPVAPLGSMKLTPADLEDGTPKHDVTALPPKPCLFAVEPERDELPPPIERQISRGGKSSRASAGAGSKP